MTDLAVGATKTLAAGEDAYVSVGEQVTFRISGTNTSSTTATAMSLHDTWDPAASTTCRRHAGRDRHILGRGHLHLRRHGSRRHA